MKKRLMLCLLGTALVSGCGQKSEPTVSNNEDILSLVSESSFSKYHLKDLIDATTDIPKTINLCDVKRIVDQGDGEITITCSNKGMYITNESAKNHVRNYQNFTYSRDPQLSDKMGYSWSNNEKYCLLTVDEDKDEFQLYCG
ncbi:hypothetical protein ACRN9C_18435 [Shewanella frigidimarina]|uniref:hypothetical protein n=1 Tax=Shewanella frigidimarina TaxID=56812 RepID=UPI003D7919CC